MMDAELEEQLAQSFGGIEDTIVQECVQLCKQYQLSAGDLHIKWEAMTWGTTPRVFTADTVTALRQRIRTDQAKERAKEKQKMVGRAALDGLMSRNLAGLGRVFGRPEGAFGAPRATGVMAGPSRDVKPRLVGSKKVHVSVPELENGSARARKYRYMYEKISERSGVLDDQIDDFAELVKSHYNIEELGDPDATTEEDTVVVGRITLDADSSAETSVRLNEASLTLESSRAMGSGARIHLRFDTNVRMKGMKRGIGGLGLFPGAIVALRGRNGGGRWFTVTEVLPLPTLAPPLVDNVTNTAAFDAVVACGPFTADADLKYIPWQNMLTKWKTEKPMAIILLGPFVDVSHPLIKIGDLDEMPVAIFRNRFLQPLKDTLDALPDIVVMLVPSVRDIVHDHAVFPQAELGADIVNDPRISLLPNPSRFSLNGVSFALSSLDVLFHLRKEEFSKPMSEINPVAPGEHETPPNDAMAKLSRHILQQRNFYPIFPPPQDLAQDVNLDVSHSERLRISDAPQGTEEMAPAVLILPSRLKQFSKVVDDTTVINPSYASKGFYATIRVSETQANQKLSPHKIQVNIVKLGD